MAKFNDGKTAPRGPKSAITTTGPATTFEGGPAYARDSQSDLFLLAVTNMVGEDTFYESAKKLEELRHSASVPSVPWLHSQERAQRTLKEAESRDGRYETLVRQVAVTDPEWLYRFIGWLRNKANMRSASVVAAAEAIKARLDAGIVATFEHLDSDQMHTLGSKDFIPQAMARADEPGEFLAYWAAKYGNGKATLGLPKPVKRGLALAATELFDEYAYAKYGQADGGYGLARVVDLVHPTASTPEQGDLFEHALNEMHKRGKPIPASLTMLHNRAEILGMPQDERRAWLMRPGSQDELKAAGITWEALSGWLGGELSASFWERLIPTMGYMALLRNLRNFEKTEISRSARRAVQERLADPAQVARSRQFPYRFLSAYKAVEGDWWNEALSDALDASVGNLPEFKGRTLVLVDTSGSMGGTVSAKSKISHAEIGALFGVALAKAGAKVDLHGFAGGHGYGYRIDPAVQFKHDLARGGSILKGVQSFTSRIGEVGHGTEITKAYRQSYDGHDRVVLVSDMQSFDSYDADLSTLVPAGVRVYGINTAGYSTTVVDSAKPNRYEVGGFSDQVFRMISLIEAGNADWPF